MTPDEPTTHCKHGDCSADEYGPGPCQFPECQVPKDSRLATTESKLSIAVAALEKYEAVSELDENYRGAPGSARFKRSARELESALNRMRPSDV